MNVVKSSRSSRRLTDSSSAKLRPAPGEMWPKAVVPYIYNNLENRKQRYVEEVQRYIEEKSCVRFKPRSETNAVDYVEYTSTQSLCDAERGKKGGKQTVHLGTDGCDYYGKILHLLMVTLGFHYVHNRPDRDYHIYVNESNIVSDQKWRFEKAKGSLQDVINTHYFINSSLHFGPTEWQKDSRYPTIVALDCRSKQLFGYSYRLTDSDIAVLKSAYC